MDLKEIRWTCVDWIDLAQDRNRWWAVVILVLTFMFHRMWGFFLMRRGLINFSGRTVLHVVI
jgi:hypothetical protein